MNQYFCRQYNSSQKNFVKNFSKSAYFLISPFLNFIQKFQLQKSTMLINLKTTILTALLEAVNIQKRYIY